MQPYVMSSSLLLWSQGSRLLSSQLPRVLSAAVASGVLSRASARRLGAAHFGTTPASSKAANPAPTADGGYADNYKKAKVTVNGHAIEVPDGVTILEACSNLGIKVPTLCAHPSLPETPGTCRVCLVQVGSQLKPACATPVWDGMDVITDSDKVKESVRGVLALMQANHPADCMACDVNGKCEFQDLTSRYRTRDMFPKLRHISHEWDDEVKGHEGQFHDQSSAAISIDYEKCIKCGRCVTACGLVQEMNVLGMQGRSHERHPSVISEAMDLSKCIECGQCAVVCPVGAINERSEWREVEDMLDSKRKVMVCVTAPAVRVAIGEELGQAPGTISTGQMVTAQRQLGFDYVFDVNFSADLTILEEGTELLKRLRKKWGLELPVQQDDSSASVSELHAAAQAVAAAEERGGHSGQEHKEGPLPLYTSCCPAWVNMVEKDYPELIPHLSTCRSPQGMMGAVVKSYFAKKMGLAPEDICLVSVMPCTAKKHEAEREELRRAGKEQDIDYVITTREFGHMLSSDPSEAGQGRQQQAAEPPSTQQAPAAPAGHVDDMDVRPRLQPRCPPRERHIPLASLPESTFDSPLGQGSGAGQIFGNTGGVMEAALRTAYELGTGQALPKLEVSEIRGLKGVKEATIRLPDSAPAGVAGRELRVAVASGIGNARHLLEQIAIGEKEYDFVEVMACPGGCIGGGGQPKTHDPMAVLKRMGAVYSIDERSAVRKSHENPSVQKLYADFLGEPGSHTAHELLHTQYTDRSHVTQPAYSHFEREVEPVRVNYSSLGGCTHHPSVQQQEWEREAAQQRQQQQGGGCGSGDCGCQGRAAQ